MIFLVGARRSGTNWLQRVVGAHPDVAVIPSETYLFSRGIQPLRERFHHGILTSPGTTFMYMDESVMLDALRDFCDRAFLPFLEAVPGAQRLAERTPEHARCVGLIGAVYPDADIVHIVRDGRDVARSLLAQQWPSAPKTIEEAAIEWRTSVEAAEADGVGLPKYRTVSYEALLSDPLPNVTALYKGLGLSTDEDVVRAALTEADVAYNTTPGDPRIASGKWRETFSAEDAATFARVAGETLVKHGYDAGERPLPAAEPAGSAQRRSRFARKTSIDPDRAFSREVLARARTIQKQLDEIVAAFNGRALQGLASKTTEKVRVHFIGRDTDWRARGPEAWKRLAAAVRDDPALAGRQIRGDLHIGVPTSTAVLTFEDGNGARHARAIVASLASDRIEQITYYQLPQ